MDKTAKIIFSVLCSALIVLFCYIVFHEAGHCLIAALCGANITEFSISGAHMSYIGGEFNAVTASVFNAAGMLLPVAISFIFMIFYRKNFDNVFYRIFSFTFSLIPLFSLIAWIFVPILSLSGKAPKDDDVTKFIISSGLNPWIVCGGAAVLLAAGAFLAWKKKVIQNYWDTCRGKEQ